ncbi:cation-translocating P-type ATPase [Thermanaerothrix daxensis]|uniref:cation-translocating P-type ATPase n=1 Tax=Thermanaerothrix daxensis TaxID=869279 RepID=UPI0009F9A505|nr:cation-translocating P-type ATPase [Thermanaerothrix daxensis]
MTANSLTPTPSLASSLPPADLNIAWHALNAHETIRRLRTPLESGLTTEEAARRLAQFGPNQLAEARRRTFLQMVVAQLKSFVVILLIVAAVISGIISISQHEPLVDSAAIIAIVILNAVLGVIQESRAEQALAALRQLAAPEAQVLRDGRRQTIPARDLVPGDIVFLEAGNYVPADLRLLEAINLRIEEAALTGESIAVEKDATSLLQENAPLGDRKNTAFMGTLVVYGRGRGVVVSTGMRTQLGMIATLLQSMEEEETPLQRKLDQLGRTLGIAALVICGLVFLTGILQGGNILEMFMVAVSLAIAAVPEGLPAIVTISLALGMREMIRRHALIRRLSSVETLGSATVICSDKTGTLTQNAMTVTRLWVDGTFIEINGRGYVPEGEFTINGQPVDFNEYPAVLTALWIGALNNDAVLEVNPNNGENAYRVVGDPTEGALLVAAAKAGALPEQLQMAYPREDEIPFDSVRKRMVTVHAVRAPRADDASPFNETISPNVHVITVKGAPDEVLRLCRYYQDRYDQPQPLDEASRQRILQANDAMTREALRVLGVAYRVVPTLPEHTEPEALEHDLVFVGLIGMIDPPRPEVIPALQKATRAGIRTLMITGDYPNTARAIAEAIGLLHPHHQVLTGAQLDAMDDATLQHEVQRTDVFARVSPQHKLRIVEALKANEEIVAMTGDGVNDAPAIKRADIGIAMGITGTDVTKETADMVLMDDNYASIVAAVEQGRIIYSNIRKFVYYLISCNLAEIFIIFLPTAFGRWLFPVAGRVLSPLLPIQLLWLNLITDGAPALALGTEKGEPDIMDHPPRPPKEPIINRFMQIGVAAQTVAITAATLLAFSLGLRQDTTLAGTLAFVTLSSSELLRAYTARSERYPLLKIGVFSNRWMNLAVLSSMALLLMVVYVPFFNPIFATVPLTWEHWKLILPLIFLPAVVAEITKAVLGMRKVQR